MYDGKVFSDSGEPVEVLIVDRRHGVELGDETLGHPGAPGEREQQQDHHQHLGQDRHVKQPMLSYSGMVIAE